ALVRDHGVTKAKAVVGLAVKRMREGWPQAKTFAALGRFVGDALNDFERDQRRAEGQRQELARLQRHREEQEQKRDDARRFEEVWSLAWQGLDEEARQAIRRDVLAGRPFLA